MGELILSIIQRIQALSAGAPAQHRKPHAFFSASQVLAPSAVPRMARNAAILVIVIPIVPVNIAYAQMIEPSLWTYVLLFAKEYALGFLMGYGIAWLFWAVQSAGDFIDNQRGAAIASSIDRCRATKPPPSASCSARPCHLLLFRRRISACHQAALHLVFRLPVMRGLPLCRPNARPRPADHG